MQVRVLPGVRFRRSATPAEHGGRVLVRAKSPNTGVEIVVDDAQAYVSASRGAEDMQALLGVDAAGRPQLLLLRKDGTVSVSAGEHPDGHGVVLAFDEKDKLIGRVPAGARWPIEPAKKAPRVEIQEAD